VGCCLGSCLQGDDHQRARSCRQRTTAGRPCSAAHRNKDRHNRASIVWNMSMKPCDPKSRFEALGWKGARLLPRILSTGRCPPKGPPFPPNDHGRTPLLCSKNKEDSANNAYIPQLRSLGSQHDKTVAWKPCIERNLSVQLRVQCQQSTAHLQLKKIAPC
jgi:hypothetical protein